MNRPIDWDRDLTAVLDAVQTPTRPEGLSVLRAPGTLFDEILSGAPVVEPSEHARELDRLAYAILGWFLLGAGAGAAGLGAVLLWRG